MARNVFFSFHYKHVWKVNQIRSIPNVTGVAAAGFRDSSLWEQSKTKGVATIKGMIDKALVGTTVTVVCVTHGTAQRKYINYEIDESLKRGNGLVAIQIHHLDDPTNPLGAAGAIPEQIAKNRYKDYKYTNVSALANWIEEAARIAGK